MGPLRRVKVCGIVVVNTQLVSSGPAFYSPSLSLCALLPPVTQRPVAKSPGLRLFAGRQVDHRRLLVAGQGG